MGTKPIKILIAEDEPAHAEAICQALTCKHFVTETRVTRSLSGYHEAVAASPPDLALIDLRLLEGVFESLMPLPPESMTFPIIVMTDSGDEAVEVGSRWAGVMECVIKSGACFESLPWTVIRVMRDWNLWSERRKTVEALRSSEEKFRAYVEQTADPIFVHDSHGNILDVNRAACEKLGYSRPELLSMNVVDIEQDIDLVSLQKAWSEMLPNRPFTLKGTHRRKDGSTCPVQIHLATFELEGQRRFSGLVRNIERCCQVEAELQARDALLQMTGEIASVGGWEFDVITGEGRWTDEVASIHDLDPLVRPTVASGLDYYADESRPQIEKAVKDVSTRGIPFDLELEIITAKGLRKWVRTKGVPVVREGKVVQVRGILQDITERKRTEESLKVSEARLAAIVETAVDAIITIDDRGIVWSFNPAAEKLFGYTSDEILGRSISMLMPSPDREQHNQYLARFKSTGEKSCAGQSTRAARLAGRRFNVSDRDWRQRIPGAWRSEIRGHLEGCQ